MIHTSQLYSDVMIHRSLITPPGTVSDVASWYSVITAACCSTHVKHMDCVLANRIVVFACNTCTDIFNIKSQVMANVLMYYKI